MKAIVNRIQMIRAIAKALVDYDNDTLNDIGNQLLVQVQVEPNNEDHDTTDEDLLD